MVTGPVDLHIWIIVAVEILAGILVGVVLRALLRYAVQRAERTRWHSDDLIFGLLAYLAPWAGVLGGLWAAVISLPLASPWRRNADHILLALAVIVATLALSRTVVAAVRVGVLARTGISGSATIFANIARIIVLAIGMLVLLDGLGVSITPLLTALGVGGLAVALALQDTLTNLFAGVHILASGKVQSGDFIQLDGGQEGYVVDTNWRNTVVRQLPNNLVIVPNATLAASTMINYHRPEQESSVLVEVGVSYDSDLEHVERVTIEVGRQVMRDVDGAVPTHEPTIRYHTFGASSIDFSVILRAAEITAKYLITHEFIKRLHRRYQAEGIEIPFPIRTIVRAPNKPRESDAERPGPDMTLPA